VPDDAGVDDEEIVAARLEAAGAGVDNGAGEPGVTDDEVAAAAEEEDWLLAGVERAHGVNEIVGGVDRDEPRGAPTEAQRGVWSELDVAPNDPLHRRNGTRNARWRGV